MASDTVSTNSEEDDLRLSWSGRWSLAHRILALNLITVLLVALSTIYLDVFRNRLSKERSRQVRIEARTAAEALGHMPEQGWPAFMASISKTGENRLRLYGPDGKLRIDSWRLTGPTYELRDPTTQGWQKDVARALDRGFNAIVGAPQLDDYQEPQIDRLQAWPEAIQAKASGAPVSFVRNAPDLTPVITAAVPFRGGVILAT